MGKRRTAGQVRADWSVPAYIACQDATLAKRRTIVGLDLTLNGSLLPAEQEADEIVIFADCVTLSEVVKLPGKNITVVARKLISHHGGFDTSGTDGSPPGGRADAGSAGKQGAACSDGGTGGAGSTGDDGAAGRHAGDIRIFAETISGGLTLQATGGLGANGQEGGHGGPGGVGGRGHDGTHIARGRTNPPSDGGSGGSGGDGAVGGGGGAGGNGGSIEVNRVESQEPTVEWFRLGGSGGDGGNGGEAGKGGDGGAGGRHMHCDKSQVIGEIIWTCGLTDARAKKGKAGSNGKPGINGACGTPGHEGSFVSKIVGYEEFSADGNTNLAACMLSYRQAKLDCLSGRYESAFDRLLWLWRTTVDDEQTEFGALHRQVGVHLRRVSQAMDYFGHPRDHVPLVSLDYYLKTTGTALLLASEIESIFNHYVDADKERETQRKLVEDSRRSATTALEQLESDWQRINDEADTTQDDIEKISGELNQQKAVLDEAEAYFKDQLRQWLEVKSWGQALDLFKCMVLVGKDLMTMENFTSLIDIGQRISDEIAEILQFRHLIQEVDLAEGDRKKIMERIGEIDRSNDDQQPDHSKCIVEREKFDALLEKFASEVAGAEDYMEQMHTYIDIVDARNQKVIRYNGLVLATHELDAQVKRRRLELARLGQSMGEDFDPGSPAVRTFMYGVHADVRDRLLDLLYQENQAFNYWSCKPKPIQFGNGSIVDLDQLHERLLHDIVDLKEGAAAFPPQPFKDFEFTFHRSAMPVEFAAFTNGERGLVMSIPADHKLFSHWAQVIATSFSLEVPGAVTSDGILYARLTSMGRAPFRASDGTRVVFSHASVEAVYQYELATGKYQAGGSLGGKDDDYVGLSPFSTWVLDIPDAHLENGVPVNSGIDLSEVDQVSLKLSGRAIPFGH